MFKGSMVAIVTPFENGRLDEKRFKALIEFQIKNGTSAIVPCGTTGESATLSLEEHERVIELTVETVAGRVPVIAGAGSNNTAEAITLTKHAKSAGVSAVLLISPYYNKPTQNGIYLHFKAVAEVVDIPIVLYNIASRTGINIEPETMAKLAQIKNIVAVKEASGNIAQMAQIMRLCGDNITLISGDDALTLPVLSIGGTGVISVVANIVPKETASLIKEFERGNIKEARKIYLHLLPLVKAMFIETNPAPVKQALGMMGLVKPELRLPLCPMLPENEAKLKKTLKEYKLI
ncbi:MAG: 4-hydroxy-tetrahydrodipicolinate synthase [Candidatus Omnitrophota bacterium]|nr:MAG: 4-hydroxy-tetrahydrodipicolinate synthase [Candidatus Omnitrophota bacterium]